VPSRLINLTSEPNSPAGGTAVPSLAVPAIAGFSGNCADNSQVEVVFTTQTNGGVRFQIWADPGTGKTASSPAAAIDYWNIPSCSWAPSQQGIGKDQTDQIYTNDYMRAQVQLDCQSSLTEQTGIQGFCLTPGTPYRVRFDAVVPYLPGPMRLGFKLAGMDSSSPIPANWISTCTLDGSTQNCAADQAAANVLPRSGRPFGNLGFGHHEDHPPGRNPDHHKPGHPNRGHRPPPPVAGPPSSTGEGANGAQSCIPLNCGVQCVWKANGTWQLLSAYTQAGGWVVVQALGGAGGAGYPAASNPGGAGGRA